MLVQPLVGVQGAVHPIDADFDQTKVQSHVESVPPTSTNLVYGKIHFGPPLLDEKLIQHGDKQHVNQQTGLCQSNLVPHDGRLRSLPFGKDLL